MQLFTDIQKITTLQERIKICVPEGKSLVIDNQTDSTAYLYKSATSKIAYPIQSKSTFEVENIESEMYFYVLLKSHNLNNDEALYIITQTNDDNISEIIEQNTVVLKK